LSVVAGLVPFAAVALVDASSLGYGLRDGLWQGVLLVAGGGIGPVTWLLWSVVGACAVCAVRIAIKTTPSERAIDGRPDVTVRGPVTYAGPGSLGGTESALRR
jgi:hypothetical protein